MNSVAVATKTETVSTKTDRRAAICEAVFELLGEVGYDRMSMDAVAARARASKATIYRTWPTKPDLVIEAVKYKLGDIPIADDTGSLRGDLVAYMRVACNVACGEAGAVVGGLLSAATRNPDLCGAVNLHVYEMKKQAYEVMLRRAVARGELGEGADAGLLHEVTHALVSARRLWDLGPLDDAYAERVVDRVLLPVLLCADRGCPGGDGVTR
jgi:AcrR family transcriptional regulator